MIVADNIALKRGNKTLFHNASFRFDRPEFVAVIGPNGAGKSTLLQLLSGYYVPTAGQVLVHQKPAPSWKPAELAKYRAYLQQQRSVFESFSVEDVLMIGRSIHFSNGSRPADAQLVERTLGDLGLLERKDQPFNHLSGGEQQRVAVARALMNNPKVIFADEPSGNLDSKNATELHELFFDLRKDYGQTFVIVTHNVQLAEMADRTLVMSDGFLVQ